MFQYCKFCYIEAQLKKCKPTAAQMWSSYTGGHYYRLYSAWTSVLSKTKISMVNILGSGKTHATLNIPLQTITCLIISIMVPPQKFNQTWTKIQLLFIKNSKNLKQSFFWNIMD